MISRLLLTTGLLFFAACESGEHYDVLITGGTVYDGIGGIPVVTDVAISGDRVAAIGDLGGATADQTIDATGLAVAPGFINMLSWATESLIIDGHSHRKTEDRVQSEDRCHRIGSEIHDSVSYNDIVVPRTIDTKILRDLRADTERSSRLMGDTARAIGNLIKELL